MTRRRTHPRTPYPVLQVAALVLHRTGYRTEQITSLLRQPGLTRASLTEATPDLLDAAAKHLAGIGFTYYGVAEAIAELRTEVGAPAVPAKPPTSSADQLDLFGEVPG